MNRVATSLAVLGSALLGAPACASELTTAAADGPRRIAAVKALCGR